jgi:hypothetical protein
MEKDTRRLALISVGLGIAIVTLLPARAGISRGFHPDLIFSLGTTLWRNLRETDAVDLIQNVLLYLPLGYFAAARATGDVAPGAADSPRRRLIQACLLGLLLSSCLELLQLWIPGRFSSVSDVFTNAMGAYLGGMAARLAPAEG